MADFTSSFWSWFIIAIVVGGIAWMVYLLVVTNKSNVPEDQIGKPTGHVWDENLVELNNPLPQWWLYMFYITVVFGIIYLALYPGLGSFKGLLGWSGVGQYEAEVEAAEQQTAPMYQGFLQQEIAALAQDKDAMKTGERLFVNYCAVCHGADARGARGFPNLRDDDWLYGSSPETIKASIMYGRNGVMPAWEGPLGGEDGVRDVAQYVMSLSGRKTDAAAVQRGQEKYAMFCAGCHMPDGSGNVALGAPRLNDGTWLYGGSPRAIEASIAKGRSGIMPPHAEFLGEAKVHVLAAYIFSLAHEED